MRNSRSNSKSFSWLTFGIVLPISLIVLAILWYLILSPFNFHAADFWAFIIVGLGGFTGLALFLSEEDYCEHTASRSTLTIVIICFVIFLLIALFSSRLICHEKYKEIAQIKSDGVFVDDIPAIDSSKDIPTIDKATAQKLGDRAMGTMEKYLSQYEVSPEYNLICYKGNYYRISPLMYGNVFKYFNNKEIGIPAYVLVDVYTGKVQLIELDSEKSIKYSTSAFFGKDLMRYLRLKYPTKLFAEANFEIDDDGVPYYVVPTVKMNAFVFGAPSINTIMLVNSATGEINEYSVDNVPDWVDNVYDVTRIMEIIDWNYSLVHGPLNFSDRDVRKTSYSFDKNQYYAIPKDGHVYIYTGVTSAGGDESNIGFLLIDMRTGNATYYPDPGAEESSAQESARGLVQQYGYSAGPVMLVNINDEQTYFFTLKDAQLLVKKYALVNKADYTLVIVEDTIEQAVDAYCKKLRLTGASSNIESPFAEETISGNISVVYEVILEGNTTFIIYLEGGDEFYISSIANDFEQPAKLVPRSNITLNYSVINDTNVVSKIKFN